jgi:hypothetical protein
MNEEGDTREVAKSLGAGSDVHPRTQPDPLPYPCRQSASNLRVHHFLTKTTVLAKLTYYIPPESGSIAWPFP